MGDTAPTMQVGIYLYDEAEVLDFAGPFEVFSTASRVHGKLHPEAPPPFAVSLIAEHAAPVRARAGFLVQPHHAIANHPPLDMLVVAGGVHTAEMEKPSVTEWIARVDQTTQLTASVCTGAFLLGRAGLLSGRVTTHWEDIPDLRALFPALEVAENTRWVDGGRIVTSGGISAGLDMSLYLVGRLTSPALAHATARQMEYDWRETP